MSDELNRIAVALEAIADYLLIGLVAHHGSEIVNEVMEAINSEGETE